MERDDIPSRHLPDPDLLRVAASCVFRLCILCRLCRDDYQHCNKIFLSLFMCFHSITRLWLIAQLPMVTALIFMPVLLIRPVFWR